MTTTKLFPGAGIQRVPEVGPNKIPTRIGEQTMNSDTQTNQGQVQADPQEVLRRLVVLGAGLASIHRLASEAYASINDYESALAHQEAAVRFEPQELEYRNQLGFLRYVCGDDGAAEDFQYVIENDPENAEAYFNLAMIYFGQGRYYDAEQLFMKAAENNPQDAETWNNLGVARFHQGRLADARASFEEALRVDPNNQDSIQNLQDLQG
ncbi:MAG TPA: tetratricopeptide repeat protein [Planctomycetes bacterium]|nr:tetratricopeptide repeat protein [Planctomycetota bacterium]